MTAKKEIRGVHRYQ